MQGFVKLSENSVKVRYGGYEKAAVLLCELGGSASVVINCLKFTDSEKHKLLKALQSLGTYDANNIAHVTREQDVLKEALEYGKQKNILSSKPVAAAAERDKNKEMWKIVKENPDKVAGLLGSWLEKKD